MRSLIVFLVLLLAISSCQNRQEGKGNPEVTSSPLIGTWELVTGTIIENGDTTITDYTQNVRFIKIINNTHFSFLNHDLNQGADSSATFVAGGGKYTLQGNKYRESLEYCNYREWEGNDFDFEISIKGDTLIQKGIEKIEELGVERLNIEVYTKVVE